jgi:hypothetical protein
MDDPQQVYTDLLPRIKALADLSDADLPNEMASLKKALMANPDACALMHPEDIGDMVEALRRITGQALASAKASKTKAPSASALSKKKLTAEELQAALDDL